MFRQCQEIESSSFLPELLLRSRQCINFIVGIKARNCTSGYARRSKHTVEGIRGALVRCSIHDESVDRESVTDGSGAG